MTFGKSNWITEFSVKKNTGRIFFRKLQSCQISSKSAIPTSICFLVRSFSELSHSYGWRWENLETFSHISWGLGISLALQLFLWKENSRIDQGRIQLVNVMHSNQLVSQNYTVKQSSVKTELGKTVLPNEFRFIHCCTNSCPSKNCIGVARLNIQ